jgi:hypothetical protein
MLIDSMPGASSHRDLFRHPHAADKRPGGSLAADAQVVRPQSDPGCVGAPGGPAYRFSDQAKCLACQVATEDRSSPAYPWIGRNLVGGACFAGASF